jgi:hypothetical protein
MFAADAAGCALPGALKAEAHEVIDGNTGRVVSC